MELTITSDFAKHLFTRSKKDLKLAHALARQFLNSVEPHAMARFLLQPEVAEQLLAARVMKDPERTLKELQSLDGRPAGAPARSKPRRAKKQRRAAPARPRRRRGRLTREQSEALKEQVKRYLARHRWSTRKELTAVVDLPTQAIYRRIIGELLEAGEVISRGQKAKTAYALGGRGVAKKATKKKATKKKATKKKATKKKATKKKATKKKATKKKATKKAAPPVVAFGPSIRQG